MMDMSHCLVHIRAVHATGAETALECPNSNTCGITYRSDYTGGLHRIFPQVSFVDQLQSFEVNTASTQGFRNYGKELPLRAILVDGAPVDF